MRILVTGGAGFIGRAACRTLLAAGHEVLALDDLSNPLSHFAGHGVIPIHAEMAQWAVISSNRPHGLEPCDAILHLGAQTAVTRSYQDPRLDFNSNAWASAEMIWLAQRWGAKLIYASTNKVFGSELPHRPIRDSQPIAPSTPYGVTKAFGALYARDLLPDSSWVFHQSCIFGEEQEGSFDQGWVAHLRRQIRDGKEIICCGNGFQIRDLLDVYDLMRAYLMALNGQLAPGSYVIGGGEENQISFRRAVELLGGEISRYEEWRPHDQRFFVSANEGMRAAGWLPIVRAENRLRGWGGQIKAGG